MNGSLENRLKRVFRYLPGHRGKPFGGWGNTQRVGTFAKQVEALRVAPRLFEQQLQLNCPGLAN